MFTDEDTDTEIYHVGEGLEMGAERRDASRGRSPAVNLTSEWGQERKMRGLQETKDLAWEQGRGWEQVHSGHAGLDFSGTSRELIDIGARAWKGAPGWKWGPGTCQHSGDDPSAPGMGSCDLEKSLDGRLGCTGCSEWRSEGTKKQTGQVLEGVLLQGLGDIE